MRNANVFPDPVFAAPNTSCPWSDKPIVCVCMSVGFTYEQSFKPKPNKYN